MKQKIKHNNAFTLAEVLITLGIIGVVAAVTMPTLISNYQKAYTVNKIKKNIAIFSQAIQRSFADEQGFFDWDKSIVTGTDVDPEVKLQYSRDTLAKRIVPYLNVSRDCVKNPELDCFPDPVYFLNGQQIGGAKNYDKNRYSLILSDGTPVTMALSTVGTDNTITILFDVNGPQRPNTIGKDIFEIKFSSKGECLVIKTAHSYTRESLLSKGASYSCNKEAYMPGFRCIDLIIKDGWKISDDYPW